LKRIYNVDGYYICLNLEDKDNIIFCVKQSNYWYGLWSHQRQSLLWKGYVQIELNTHDDDAVLEVIEAQERILKGENNE
jgi:hypothetical protein